MLQDPAHANLYKIYPFENLLYPKIDTGPRRLRPEPCRTPLGERPDRLMDAMTFFKDPMAETLKTDLERQGLRMESARSSGNTKINCAGPTRPTPTRASPMPRR